MYMHMYMYMYLFVGRYCTKMFLGKEYFELDAILLKLDNTGV